MGEAEATTTMSRDRLLASRAPPEYGGGKRTATVEQKRRSAIKAWEIFLPHFAVFSAGVGAFWIPTLGCNVSAILAVAIPPVIVLLAIAFLPAVEAQMLAEPRGDPAKATQALILCFSYESETPTMRPGPANEELLAYVRNSMPEAHRIIVQEGVWAAVPGAPQWPEGPHTLRVVDRVNGREVVREIFRFHRHDPKYYLNTLEALFCASRILDPKQLTVLVTHELQLARAEWDLRKVCPECPVVIPPIRGISFVPGGAHPQAWSRSIYRLVELFLSRPRDYFARKPVKSAMLIGTSH